MLTEQAWTHMLCMSLLDPGKWLAPPPPPRSLGQGRSIYPPNSDRNPQANDFLFINGQLPLTKNCMKNDNFAHSRVRKILLNRNIYMPSACASTHSHARTSRYGHRSHNLNRSHNLTWPFTQLFPPFYHRALPQGVSFLPVW